METISGLYLHHKYDRYPKQTNAILVTILYVVGRVMFHLSSTNIGEVTSFGTVIYSPVDSISQLKNR